MSILVVAEHDNKQLKPATLNVITAACELGKQVTVLVAGYQCDDVVNAVARVSGVNEVLHIDDVGFQYDLAERQAELIVQHSEGKTHLLAPATTFGKNVMPRVAALLDVAQVSDVIAVVDSNTYKRPIYAGNAIATVKSHDPVQVLTVRPTNFVAAEPSSNTANIKTIDTNINSGLSEFIKEELHGGDRPELTAADIVISGGRGLQSKETFERLAHIADRLGAAIGASRAAVDGGLAPNDWQVGQTGKVVAPQLYIAVGISGAIQHLAGMKDSKIIVAINKDPDAPIFQIADYGLVADLFEVLPEWEATLEEMGY